jgi:HSP20 family molecular chaperone IbpA
LRICVSQNNRFGLKSKPHFDINSSITFVDLDLEEKVYAKLENGVLEVILPKVQTPKAHIVQIQWFLIF